jgi:predicted ATPase
MVLESGLLREHADAYELTGPLPSLAIPATLHDSVMARLDRLATVKEVAHWGATLGRAFPYDLLRAVAPWDDATLQQALARLVEAELLYQRGLLPAPRRICSNTPSSRRRPISRCCEAVVSRRINGLLRR